MTVPIRRLRVGDLIRLKVPTSGGWKGVGIVCEDMATPYDTVCFIKQDSHTWMDGDYMIAPCMACPHEVAKVRDQGTDGERTSRIEWCRLLAGQKAAL